MTGVIRSSHTVGASEDTFKVQRGNNPPTGYATLRNQLPLEKPHGEMCTAFRCGMPYSLPTISDSAGSRQARHVLFGGRSRRPRPGMHQTDTEECGKEPRDKPGSAAGYRDPFSGGEPAQLLFYIPPRKKGVVDEGIAGVRSVMRVTQMAHPRGKGVLESPTLGVRHD